MKQKGHPIFLTAASFGLRKLVLPPKTRAGALFYLLCMAFGLAIVGVAFQEMTQQQPVVLDFSNTKLIGGSILTCFGLWPIFSFIQETLPK